MDLTEIINLCLTNNYQARPNVEQLLNHEIIQIKIKLYNIGILKNEDDNNKISNDMMSTIKLPRNISQLIQKLPKKRYTSKRACSSESARNKKIKPILNKRFSKDKFDSYIQLSKRFGNKKSENKMSQDKKIIQENMENEKETQNYSYQKMKRKNQQHKSSDNLLQNDVIINKIDSNENIEKVNTSNSSNSYLKKSKSQNKLLHLKKKSNKSYLSKRAPPPKRISNN